MELSIINIENSKGIRLSKIILEKYNIGNKVELILKKGYIILKSKAEPRKNRARIIKSFGILSKKNSQGVKGIIKETFVD